MSLPTQPRLDRGQSLITKKFEENLRLSGVSSKTIRNYRADLAHFAGWAKLQLQKQGCSISSTDDVFSYFSGQLVALYKGHHLENRVPEATTNRRLSTLRNISKFLVAQGIIEANPMTVVSNLKQAISWKKNIETIVVKFEKYLENEGISKVSRKNYLSDIRQFLNWIPEAGTV